MEMLERIVSWFVEEVRLKDFEELLEQNNYARGIRGVLEDSFLWGAALSLFIAAILLVQNTPVIYITVCSVVGLLFPALFFFLFHSFSFEQNKRKKESLVPDVLLQASVFPRNTPMQKIMKYIAKADYGLLSREFETAVMETSKGATIEQALSGIRKRCRSKIIDRAVGLLIQGYNSGAEMSSTFKDAAEDILETQSVLRERSSAMVIEKYTLLFAGGFIVPAILGLLVGMVNRMNFSSINLLGIGLSAVQRKEMLDAALLANQLYIFEYALLASLFVANQEGNRKKAFLYALFLLPLSFAAYSLAKSA